MATLLHEGCPMTGLRLLALHLVHRVHKGGRLPGAQALEGLLNGVNLGMVRTHDTQTLSPELAISPLGIRIAPSMLLVQPQPQCAGHRGYDFRFETVLHGGLHPVQYRDYQWIVGIQEPGEQVRHRRCASSLGLQLEPTVGHRWGGRLILMAIECRGRELTECRIHAPVLQQLPGIGVLRIIPGPQIGKDGVLQAR